MKKTEKKADGQEKINLDGDFNAKFEQMRRQARIEKAKEGKKKK